jgi:hypothetical protein
MESIETKLLKFKFAGENMGYLIKKLLTKIGSKSLTFLILFLFGIILIFVGFLTGLIKSN